MRKMLSMLTVLCLISLGTSSVFAQEFQGTILKKGYAVGSKSEREALVFKLEDQQELLLLRIGGNPFEADSELLSLVGQQMILIGETRNNKLYFSKILKKA